ncbi:MAG: lipopolysaccharide heptosyltransferase II [Magnetococcales bacterium]|nr:lipopolysaccharide heptosyltransferase II [Magnetococcales bacterium]
MTDHLPSRPLFPTPTPLPGIAPPLAEEQATLVVGPSWVGDMVMAQSLFKILKTRDPNTPIDVLAPLWSSPLLARMPEVRQAIPLTLLHGQLGLKRRFQAGRALCGGYKQALILPNSFKSALIPFHAKVPRRIGFIGEMRWGLLTDARPLNRQALPRTADRFVALGLERDDPLPAPLPAPNLLSFPERAAAVLKRLAIPEDDRPLLALSPGAEYGPAKQWPEHHFSALAHNRGKAGWKVLLLGSPKESGLCHAIAQQAGINGYNLAGKTSLEEAVDILSVAQGVVCNDSGLMHVAAALGTPVVAVFGSSDPEHTPPVGPKARVISLNLPCAPCFKRICPEHHLRCLEEITPDIVLKQLAVVTQL